MSKVYLLAAVYNFLPQSIEDLVEENSRLLDEKILLRRMMALRNQSKNTEEAAPLREPKHAPKQKNNLPQTKETRGFTKVPWQTTWKQRGLPLEETLTNALTNNGQKLNTYKKNFR